MFTLYIVQVGQKPGGWSLYNNCLYLFQSIVCDIIWTEFFLPFAVNVCYTCLCSLSVYCSLI